MKAVIASDSFLDGHLVGSRIGIQNLYNRIHEFMGIWYGCTPTLVMYTTEKFVDDGRCIYEKYVATKYLSASYKEIYMKIVR